MNLQKKSAKGNNPVKRGKGVATTGNTFSISDENKSNWIVGRNAVREAFRGSRSLRQLWVQEAAHGESLEEIITLAEQSSVPVMYVTKETLDDLSSGVHHQGVAVEGKPVAFQDLDDVLSRVKKTGAVPLLLLLDELQDPQNVGALLRTANAAGVHGVLLPSRRSCPLNSVVAKISAGAVEHVPVIQIGNIPHTLQELKKRGFWVVGADMDGRDLFFDADLSGPLVLVVGAEGKGLGRLVKENCDFLVRIPMLGQVQSLNASVAGGILLYDIVRQRLQKAR